MGVDLDLAKLVGHCHVRFGDTPDLLDFERLLESKCTLYFTPKALRRGCVNRAFGSKDTVKLLTGS